MGNSLSDVDVRIDFVRIFPTFCLIPSLLGYFTLALMRVLELLFGSGGSLLGRHLLYLSVGGSSFGVGFGDLRLRLPLVGLRFLSMAFWVLFRSFGSESIGLRPPVFKIDRPLLRG